MDSVLVESPMEAKSLNFGHLSRPNYDTMLRESIERFLVSVHSETLDLSSFRSIFSRLLHSSADPPLEIIWFYSAISYHESFSSSKGISERVLAVKNLLQLFTACSASCAGLKSIALLAPAISDLYYCVLEEENYSGKAMTKKANREIEGLVEGILSYISICSGKSCDDEEFGPRLLPCFLDLVQVWTVSRSDSWSGSGEFFPLISDEIRFRFKEEGCGVGHLAGVVIVEAFLLKLCLKIRAGSGRSRGELHKELMTWAVSSITVFQNRVFFDVLLRLLLDSTLPTVSLLDAKDENLLRDILYDVVILVDYSFLNPGKEMDQSYAVMRSLSIRRLIVTHGAILKARVKGAHGKAISYMNAFSTSLFPSEIINWVTNQIGREKVKKPNANTPQVLLKWLVDIEDRGLKLFEDSVSKHCTNLMFDESKDAPQISMFNMESKPTEDDIYFFDNKGEVAEGEGMESMDTAFLAAAQSMKSSKVSGRKRKEEREAVTPVKFVKHLIRGNTMQDIFFPCVTNGVGSSSEVENPCTDDEMD